MDVRGALFDLSTIRSIRQIIDSFDYSEGYLEGVDGFNVNPLRRFKKEFPDVIKALSTLDDVILKANGIINSQEFVSQFKNYKEYYNELAVFVEEYCKKHKIKCHIKNGTKL